MSTDERGQSPDARLLALLEKQREDERFLHGDGPLTGSLSISLDLDSRRCAIEENWHPSIQQEERIRLTIYAAISSILRYAAWFPWREHKNIINRFALGQAWEIGDWRIVDDVEWEDVTYCVELYGTTYGDAVSAYLDPSVPEGLNVAVSAGRKVDHFRRLKSRPPVLVLI